MHLADGIHYTPQISKPLKTFRIASQLPDFAPVVTRRGVVHATADGPVNSRDPQALINRSIIEPALRVDASICTGGALDRSGGVPALCATVRTHPGECFNSPHVSVRASLKRLGAKRTAERNHPIAMFDPREPLAADDGFLRDGALDKSGFNVTGVKLTHRVLPMLEVERVEMTPSTRS